MDRCSSRNRIGEKRGYAYETVSVDTEYEYGPFGEVIRSSGTYANANSFRFSTKYLDVETGLYYYGYRHYDSATGRWLSKDPIEEQGGLNLYAFVGNRAINFVDYDGRIWNLGSAGIGAVAGLISGGVSGSISSLQNGGGLAGAVTGAVVGAGTGAVSGGLAGASGNPMLGATVGGAVGGAAGSAAGQFVGNLTQGQSIGEAVGNIDPGAVAGATAGGAAAGALGGASALANGATLAVAASTAPGEGLIVYMGETLGDELLTPDDEDSGGGNGSGPTCNN